MEIIREKLAQVIKQLFGAEIEPEMAVAPEETGADYASNVAMRLAKVARKAPLLIAEEIKGQLEGDDGADFEVSVAAPGFLNFRLKDEYFENLIENISQDEYFERKKASSGDFEAVSEGNISPDEYSGKTVITEFSDPNPFKVLHVGHLYTSVVGDAISRLLEYAGAKVVRANFGGDVGLHVGKTLWAVLSKGYTPEELTIEKIAKCYVEGTGAYEDDEAAKREIVAINKKIYKIAELGREATEAEDYEDVALAKLYWRGRELSYEYFEEFYARIGVRFDKYYPESTVAGRGLEEVRGHVGTTYEESDGAIVYRGEKVGLHTRVFINREGVPTYEAKDVGLIFTKWDDYRFDESVVITGNEQGDYMKVVLSSVKEYAPELVERTRHLTHGLVKLPGNVKMSSRKGNFIKAVDVLELVQEMLGGEKADPKLVMAAIKYAFLRYKMGGDIVFDPKESVSMTGNSGVYLLYSAVRAKKILQKVATSVNVSTKVVQDETEVELGYERKLNKKIVQYEATVTEAVMEKAPYKICNYLYELAQEFSRFYEHVPVAGSARAEQRAKLVRAYLNVMTHGLGLLGIEAPEEM